MINRPKPSFVCRNLTRGELKAAEEQRPAIERMGREAALETCVSLCEDGRMRDEALAALEELEQERDEARAALTVCYQKWGIALPLPAKCLRAWRDREACPDHGVMQCECVIAACKAAREEGEHIDTQAEG